MAEESDDDGSRLINNVIDDFTVRVDLLKKDLINLLLDKMKRTYIAHHFLNDFIDRAVNESLDEQSLIDCIEKENDTKLIISDQEKQILITLAHLNIEHKRTEYQIRRDLWNFLDKPKSTYSGTDGPLRISITQRYLNSNSIVIGKIESGSCHVGDKCLVMLNQTHVEITKIIRENVETDSCTYGDSAMLMFKSDQEEILPGFILCDVHQDPCKVGRVFDVQVAIVEYKSIICPGYSAAFHIHAAVAKVQLKKLIELVDHVTDRTTEMNPRFIKQGQVAVARFALLSSERAICMELFECHRELGRFTLCSEGSIVAVGNVLEGIQ